MADLSPQPTVTVTLTVSENDAERIAAAVNNQDLKTVLTGYLQTLVTGFETGQAQQAAAASVAAMTPVQVS